MSRPAIRVENLGKAYRIGLKEEIPDTLTGALTGWIRSPLTNWNRLRRLNTFGTDNDSEDTIWALKDVSFDVQEGDVLGIIGRNGAGKSTLLKILSRITEPTTGRVRVRGRVSSLLEVGTGFHPELSGRENVYMNGTILGMTKREIDRKFDEIVEFSGVERFLDTPIKRYSSGMKVRLAFAVAAHLEPEILIIDEVLAVGDAEFQKKCLGKMQDVAKTGRTVLFVSHNMPTVRSLTTTGLYLAHGTVAFQGLTENTIDAYLSDAIRVGRREQTAHLDFYRRDKDDDQVRFNSITIGATPTADASLPQLALGDPIVIQVAIDSKISLSQACLSFVLIRNQEQRAVTLFSHDAGFPIKLTPGRHLCTCRIDSLPLTPGVYTLHCGINKNARATAFDVIVDYPAFEVVMPSIDTGALDWPHRPWGAVHWSNVTWSHD